MKFKLACCALALTFAAIGGAQAQTAAPAPGASTVPVTVDNFTRAESDLYFHSIAIKEGGFGKFFHNREPAPIDNQNVIRLNRDTLYSGAVFDLDAGPVTITLPNADKRFMSMQVITAGANYSDPHGGFPFTGVRGIPMSNQTMPGRKCYLRSAPCAQVSHSWCPY